MSYRQLPLNLYQIQIKFRDEIRPRFGLMRGREFIMKDAYSFHTSEEDAEKEYENMYNTYTRIFERCGLRFTAVEAETGAIGGRFSHEFMVLADTGEDVIVRCQACGYSANLERAECRRIEARGGEADKPLEKVHTPGMRSVEEVSGYLGVSPERLIKTLLYETSDGPVVALVRGDYEINEAKLKRLLGCEWLHLAGEERILEITGAPPGFAGPIGIKGRVVADHSVSTVSNGVTGANQEDYHYVNVNPGRDFSVDLYGDLRFAVEGDPCPRCNATVALSRGIEVGHIFKLGTKYSKAMGATFLDEKGRERLMVMGCYGIGIGRTVAAAIEQNHDEKGIIWPMPLAPYHVYLLAVNVKDGAIREASERIYRALGEAGIHVLYDDRDERAGVKFNDADLLGIPWRITVGSKIGEGRVEIKRRDSRKVETVSPEEAVERLKERIKGEA